MKIYVQLHEFGAGKWIYKGYAHAWIYHGYQVEFISSLNQINLTQPYLLMITDGFVNDIKYLEKSVKTFLYVSPNRFPNHWGQHPNWISSLNKDKILLINNLNNVFKWNFANTKNEYFNIWENVYTLPLAFDNINYETEQTASYISDVCFVGGIANNGFNEKQPIMDNIFKAFLKSGINCAFYINKNISHFEENNILLNSKICLNIHDLYQRTLGLDTNERTFKSLGINGLLVSDKVDQLGQLFKNIFMSNNEKDLVDHCKYLLAKDKEEIKSIKDQNKKDIEENHTYIKRVEFLIKNI